MSELHIESVRAAAEEALNSGYYCAESVVSVIAKKQGIESDLLPRVASAFCGGMAGTRGTCGALTGAVIGVSLAFGRSSPSDSLKMAYTATNRLVREFEEAFGTRNCHELLGCDLGTREGKTIFREKGLSTLCTDFTGKAAELAATIIDECQKPAASKAD
jgi:C_GCAxxG_C_C family probable redox protein